jgi:hypothetical protein
LDETIFPKELKIHPIGGNYFPKEVGKIIQLDETIVLKKWKNHPMRKIIQLDETIYLWNGVPTSSDSREKEKRREREKSEGRRGDRGGRRARY